MKIDQYKEYLFRLFMETSKKDLYDYTNKDTRTYANHDDYIQIRAISPTYTEDDNIMYFEIRNSWLRLEVEVIINNKRILLYRNIFRIHNDNFKRYILNVYNVSKQNMIDNQFKNTPFSKREIRKLKLKKLKMV